jgi:hypothetical protein
MRKYKVANSASCSLWPLRRLTTTRRPRRIFSQVELIFRESTNVAAALVSVCGTSRSARFTTGVPDGGLVPFSPIAIFDLLFDAIPFFDCMN